MAFDQPTRLKLAALVTEARRLLVAEFTRQLQNDYGLDPVSGTIASLDSLERDDSQLETARILRETIAHYEATAPMGGIVEAMGRVLREQAFTVINRLAALRMAEARGLIVESVGKGYDSKAFRLYSQLAGPALGEVASRYAQFLFSLFDELALDLPVLFDRFAPQGRLFPGDNTLLSLFALLNAAEIESLWSEDETIGWIYQYFNSKEERKKMRQSRAPRNSRELAVRNQFFTPRYVVEFLADNTLGRLWYEMTKGATRLAEECRYLVRKPTEVFLAQGEEAPAQPKTTADLSQEELLRQPVHVPYRPVKDPREIRMLDPACGSMHFGLYAFDLFEAIYEEAWDLEGLPTAEGLQPLHEVFATRHEYLREVPRLILEHNIHGIDIDPRAAQIAGLSLWLRAQKSWLRQDLKPTQRPRITRSNVVCAEPMPGEAAFLQDFIRQELAATPEGRVLGKLVTEVFDAMKLAGEAGALLKIEEEISGAVTEAHRQWKAWRNESRKPEQGELFPELVRPKPERLEFDFSGITDAGFWGRTEELIYTALKAYAERAERDCRYQRRLFAEDTAQGFAFIDLCRKNYQVVVMNPPFGEAASRTREYIADHYAVSKGDLLANFLQRFTGKLEHRAFLGAITNRSCYYLGSFGDFRKEYLQKHLHLDLFADLGDKVLDATVETAALCFRNNPTSTNPPAPPPARGPSLFFRLLLSESKDADLACLCNCIASSVSDERIFRTPVTSFDAQVGSPYTYWISPALIAKLGAFPPLEPTAAELCVGLQTGEDWRFLRLWMEVDARNISPGVFSSGEDRSVDAVAAKAAFGLRTRDWAFFSKTETASPWISPIHMLVKWHKDGHEIKNFFGTGGKQRSRPQNLHAYFRPGLSYMGRCTRLVPYIVPAGVVPTARRAQAYPSNDALVDVTAALCSNVGTGVARFRGEKFAWPNYQKGMVQLIPSVVLDSRVRAGLHERLAQEVEMRRSSYSRHEEFLEFVAPAPWGSHIPASTMWDLGSLLGADMEGTVARAYGLDEGDLDELERDVREAIELRLRSSEACNQKPGTEEDGGNEKTTDSSHDDEDDADEIVETLDDSDRARAHSQISYWLGVLLGRWDVRHALDPGLTSALPDPFDALPVCPRGMLCGPDGLPATPGRIVSEAWLRSRRDAATLPDSAEIGDAVQVLGPCREPIGPACIPDQAYPAPVAWDGCIAQDSTTPGDPRGVVSGLHKVSSLMYGEAADDIEQECLSALGAPTLSQYLQKPTLFFADHLKRYSKSRRQAPIYWPLSIASGTYTLWLYYHRLTDQTLFTCVNDFVEPKIGEITEDIAHQKANGKAGKAAEAGLEALEDLLVELQNFRDELLRLAHLPWKPNLNDGVVITAAPLWKLFAHRPWQRKLQEAWNNLERGEYDWAHLALTLWPDRVRKKCETDRSLAIAHDLEELYAEPAERPARRGRKRGGA